MNKRFGISRPLSFHRIVSKKDEIAMDLHRAVCCCVTVVLLSLAACTEAKEILGVFPHFGYSHFKVFYPLLRNLAERGHQVTVITHIPSTDPPLDTYEEWLLPRVDVINVATLSDLRPRTWLNLAREYVGLHNEGQMSCGRLYDSGFIQRALQQHLRVQFDILITEYFNSDCQLVLAHLMDVPIVALSSCLLMPWYYERILLPDTPSHVQSEFIGFTTPLVWHERLTNFLQSKLLPLVYRFHTNRKDNALIARYLNVTVDVNAIAKHRTSLILGNQHYSLTGIRPHSEQFVEIGGIHIQETNVNATLPKEISEFLDKSLGGVMFISWGSMIRASSMDKSKLSAIVSVLEQLNMHVIWKWETDDLPSSSDRILFVKWAPQLQLLCHPIVKLFWGHGGLLGTTEAIHCGKPLIVTPIYGDQFVNAHAVQNRKIGLILDYGDINEKHLIDVIQQALQQSFANNAAEISKIFRDRPLNPQDTATWWVEHLLHHKRSHEVMRTHAVDLNWFVYNSLDCIGTIAISVAVMIFTFKYLAIKATNLCSRTAKMKVN